MQTLLNVFMSLSLKGGWIGGQTGDGGVWREWNRWLQRRRKIRWKRGEGVTEGRQANETGSTDEGRHGRGESRETSKDFNVTAFHTDNSCLSRPPLGARTITHTHTHIGTRARARHWWQKGRAERGVACSCITLREWRWVLTLQPPHANLAVNTNTLTG